MKRYEGTPISFEQIDITNGFWKEQQELVRSKTITAIYDRFEETGRFEALKGEWKDGMPFKPHIFWDSDITKWIEGAAFYLQKNPDQELEKKIDDLIDRMEKLQMKDGYLDTYFIIVEPEARFTRRGSHELYCAGHLIEGAIAYYKATGKRKMLDIAIRFVDLIDQVFRVEQSAAFDTPGHQEIEIALVKLYKLTQEERYKKLAEFFIDNRGCSHKDMESDTRDMINMQSHMPVREQRTAEGHAVRALYLYSAMADLALLNREEKMTKACEAIFENIVQKKMQITGGVGSTYLGESFTFDYHLPEYTAYNETCASIAMAMFCRRMWLIDADQKYADHAELVLYNAVLSGMSLSGNRFFYENPLAANPARNTFNSSRASWRQEHLPILERVKVFNCSCCPPNLVRITGAIGNYMYSISEDTIYAHCYMEGKAHIRLGEQEIILNQKTNYPYEGKINLEILTEGNFMLALRIPGWCVSHGIFVNGEKVSPSIEKGYAYLRRTWVKGDCVLLDLDMSVNIVEANPRVSNLCGRVAIMRGPLVFCGEEIDNQKFSLRDVRIGSDSSFQVAMETIIDRNLPVLYGQAQVRKDFGALYRVSKDDTDDMETGTLRLIPYFAWANRGVTEMNVWFLKK